MKKIKPYKNFYKRVAELYGPRTVVYGPYIRKSDGRKIVNLRFSPHHQTTKLYAKVKLEIKIGIRLSKKDQVDHIDQDSTNDAFSNLQLLNSQQNNAKCAMYKYGARQRFVCPTCGTVMYRSKSRKWVNLYSALIVVEVATTAISISKSLEKLDKLP